jgi:hypothetical protein
VSDDLDPTIRQFLDRTDEKETREAIMRASRQQDAVAGLPLSGASQGCREGRLPRGIGLEQLRELPLEWDRQFEALDPI